MRLIDADELLDKIVNVPSKVTEKTFYDKEVDLLTGSAYRQNEIEDIVNDMPTVEQKHGHWESKKYCTYICSNCGFDYFDDILKEHTKAELSNISKYCPVCGVKMEGVEYYE